MLSKNAAHYSWDTHYPRSWRAQFHSHVEKSQTTTTTLSSQASSWTHLLFAEGTLIFWPDVMTIPHHHEVLLLFLLFIGGTGKWIHFGFLPHKFFSVCFSSLLAHTHKKYHSRSYRQHTHLCGSSTGSQGHEGGWNPVPAPWWQFSPGETWLWCTVMGPGSTVEQMASKRSESSLRKGDLVSCSLQGEGLSGEERWEG